MVKNKEVIYRREAIFACLSAAILLNISTASLADPSTKSVKITPFEVTSASWDARKSSLRAKGTGQSGETVSVVNATTLDPVGSSSVERSRWSVTSNDPSSVPCSLKATQSDGQSVIVDVNHAPADCDAGTGGGGDTGGGTGGGTTPPPVIPNVSINSTSQNGLPSSPVPEQPMLGLDGYQIFAINDLGMHCGDFDTRVSSILPPFNVLHATVIQRGPEPNVLTPADGVEVYYSAASNPADPILSGNNSANSGPVYSSMLADGSVYKTNFWDIAREAFDPFYPAGILPAFYPAGPLADILDLGLPAPNVEQLYLGDGNLIADQQSMPGRDAPYVDNLAERFEAYVIDQAFFINPAFQFGYVKEGVNWYEAPGIPMTAFDDFGRENPWPLYRVQAMIGATVIASTDTVVPISGEANCGSCHNAAIDGGNGAATSSLVAAGIPVATVLDDPQLDSVPLEVSKEYAADTNLIRLHDLRHGSGNPDGAKYTPDLVDQTPVVCQTCHYTPALDLAQLGPLGPENDGPLVLNGVTISDSLANGREQVSNKSMSNVMHSHHGTVTDANGALLFPEMPVAIKDDMGMIVNFQERRDALEATCYQCHPGRRTDCLRGAMSNGGMLCQDCHGNMQQVGDDFTRTVSADNVGGFELGGDFYTNPDQPRVPWANEPGCGSCHTGDAMDNLADLSATSTVVVNNYDTDANIDDIRLFQAYRSDDTKATPIVPTNKRFAENVIEADNPAVSGPDDPRIGNPMLYRVSTGHEGVFCEACHGSTHGIWPNKNPLANDNVTSNQLQGHTGTITECSTCHEGDLGNTLEGPHGMHPVGDTSFSDGGHENLADSNPDDCRACHGVNGEGTVLSRAATDRVLANEGGTVSVAKGEPVTCTHCHDNEL
ncbi:MAG: cytochrome C [Pseudomonadota bacterium]